MDEFQEQDQDDMIADEEEIFGPLQPIRPLSPLGPVDDMDMPLAVPADPASEVQPGADADKNKEPKKAKKSRPRKGYLNLERFDGKTGWRRLPRVFQDVKFRGKGFEKENLDLLLQKYEEWAQRMAPKYQFIDVVERIEGFKKQCPPLDHCYNDDDELIANIDNDDDQDAGRSQNDVAPNNEASNHDKTDARPANALNNVRLNDNFDDIDLDDILAL